MIGIYRSPSRLRSLRDEVAPAHQIVGGGAEAKQPIDETPTAVSQLAEERDGLQPAERLLNELALTMTEPVAPVSGRPTVDRTACGSPKLRPLISPAVHCRIALCSN